MQNGDRTFMKRGAVPLVSLSIFMAVVVPSCKVAAEPSVDFGTAKAAYDKFDYVTALRGLRPLADGGSAEAQFMLGKIYERGGIYEITRAAGQFKCCKEFSCSLVLSNLNCAIVQLGNPPVVMAAMLGDLAFQEPLGALLGTDNRGRTVFTKGGKMVDGKRRNSWHTTVSSVIVLGTYSLQEKRIEAAARQRRQTLGRNMTLEEAVREALAIIEEMGDNGDAPRVRVVVYENPFTRNTVGQRFVPRTIR